MSRQNTFPKSDASRAGAPKVSVVVPSFNHAPFIHATLRSIFNQTRPPAQLLVIDDGSSDGSPELIECILQDCPFPSELIARSNQGLCATLNGGFSRTSGDYFAYLSSDDLWLPDFLEARVSLLEAQPQAVLGYGHCFLIDAANQIIDCTLDWASYSDGNAREMLLQQTFAPMSPTVLYRRTSLENEGWHEQAKLEDYDLYLRLSTEGDFAFDARVLSAWRQHGHNTSRDFAWMIDARLAAQRRVADRLGVSPGELERFQTILQFAGAEDLLRLGEKSKAFKLLRQSFGGAPSTASLLRSLARLCVPYSLIKWHKKRKQGHAAKRYGPLII
ncbi:MAG: glycosyltransferase family 2 protein [Pyrinomonadaceae bacterium]|nr:glycosyltransferase family 2 protein [Pyrinomonadaceae bacterium]